MDNQTQFLSQFTFKAIYTLQSIAFWVFLGYLLAEESWECDLCWWFTLVLACCGERLIGLAPQASTQRTACTQPCQLLTLHPLLLVPATIEGQRDYWAANKAFLACRLGYPAQLICRLHYSTLNIEEYEPPGLPSGLPNYSQGSLELHRLCYTAKLCSACASLDAVHAKASAC